MTETIDVEIPSWMFDEIQKIAKATEKTFEEVCFLFLSNKVVHT